MAHIRKILVPMEGSPSSLAALSQAVALAVDLGASIIVLHVTTEGGLTPAPVERGQADREMEKAIAAAKNELGEKLDRRTESGEPLRKILEAAAAEDADLIVMGTHGRVGRLHVLMGSVAEGVVRNSNCPVMTVRQPNGEEESHRERIHGRRSLADQTRRSH